MSVDVSIIICTRNRAESLRETLSSLNKINVPPTWDVELIVVDNASSDDTATVVRNADLSQFSLRLIREERPGVSIAKNTAVEAANGDVLLFTDDDVRLPPGWLKGMTEPIRSGTGDAVAGGVVLAPHLRRPWQDETPWITSPLATTSVLDPQNPERLVGANMALSSRVFNRVPMFDPRLGPGSEKHLGEDTLLSIQLRKHGYKVVSAFDVVVEHHCDSSRLSRERFLEYAWKIGRSQGYIDFHWKNADINPASLLGQLLWQYAKLTAGRIVRYRETRMPEGLPGWEMSLLTQIYHRRELLAEYMKEPNGRTDQTVKADVKA